MTFAHPGSGRLRPAEIVLVAFLSFLAAKLALAPHIVLTPEKLNPLLLIIGALVAVTLRAAVRFRALPWPPSLDARWIARHRALLPVALAPLVLDALYLTTLSWGGGARLWQVAGTTIGVLTQVTGIAAPPLLMWLALGLHLKQRGELKAGALLPSLASATIQVVRDWAPPLVLIFSYRLMGLVLNGAAATHDLDPQLIALDRAFFFGHDPVAWLQSHTSVLLLEWMTFAYNLYFALYPLCFGALYLLDNPRGFSELSLAICLTLAIGYVGYTIVPAQGPAFAEHLIPKLNGAPFHAIASRLEQTRIQRDAFPSLHTATSLILLWAVERHRPRLFRVLLPVVASIPVACLYLGWHYETDVLAGAILALGVARLTPRWLDRAARSAPS